MREARFWKPLEGGEVRCFLCAHRCRLGLGERGKCGVRENRDGRLYSLVYARLVARHVDPVEKKPLYHFHPGSRSYSIATAGCNFKCAFCQNADISQGPRETGALPGTFFPAEEVATEAKKTRCLSVAYTYVEPTVFMEYALDVAAQARALGLKNVFVTNGFMTKEALAELSKVLDAANVDLKAFEDSFYKT
ncbi:MAG: radical SAM protein, partial [Desulfovibrionaceae bacterium]|nr:radical SAM protein [Desulfovibrionaceae bacterium]